MAALVFCFKTCLEPFASQTRYWPWSSPATTRVPLVASRRPVTTPPGPSIVALGFPSGPWSTTLASSAAKARVAGPAALATAIPVLWSERSWFCPAAISALRSQLLPSRSSEAIRSLSGRNWT